MRLEPEEHVALHRKLGRERRRELRGPGARGEHQVARVIRPRACADPDTVDGRLPPLDRLAEAQRRAGALREPEVRLDAALWRQPTRLSLEQTDPALGPFEERVARAQGRRVQHLVLEAVRSSVRVEVQPGPAPFFGTMQL